MTAPWPVDKSSEDPSTVSKPRRGQRRSGTSTRTAGAGPKLVLVESSVSVQQETDGRRSPTDLSSVAEPSSTRMSTAVLDAASADVPLDASGRPLSPRRCRRCREIRPAAAYASTRDRTCQRCYESQPNTRVCPRCNKPRELKRFGFKEVRAADGTVTVKRAHNHCTWCRSIGAQSISRNQPRRCLHCGKEKSARSFPWGPGGTGKYRRRSAVCTRCQNAEAAGKAPPRRATWEDPETGRWLRRCGKCDVVKDLERDFYDCRKPEPGQSIVATRHYWCKPCTVENSRRYVAAQREDPESLRRLRAARAAWQRDWRRRHPQRDRETQRQYMDRLLQDDDRHLRYLERSRLAYRMHRMSLGLPVRPGPPLEKDELGLARLPAGPLGIALERVFTELRAESPEPEAAVKRFSERTGVSVDLLYRYGKNRANSLKTVEFDDADAILVESGLCWFDVWQDGDDYEKARELFEGVT